MRQCTHGYPKPSNCWDCMEDGNLDPPPSETRLAPTSKVFKAEFDGHCPSCNLGIHENQLVRRMSDDSYRHDHCADDIT